MKPLEMALALRLFLDIPSTITVAGTKRVGPRSLLRFDHFRDLNQAKEVTIRMEKRPGEAWKYEKEWKIENGNSLGNRAWKFGKIGAFWPSGVLGFLRKGCGITAVTLADQAAARQV